MTRTRRGTPPDPTEPVDPTRIIGERVAAIRRYLGWTQEDLAEQMRGAGITWQRVVVAKLESGVRSFVTVEEMLGLCVVLQISPVDLLVPRDLDPHRPYRIVPNATAGAVWVREFIRGEGVLAISEYPEPEADRESLFASPGTVINPMQWMSPDRAQRVAGRYGAEYEPEEDQP